MIEYKEMQYNLDDYLSNKVSIKNIAIDIYDAIPSHEMYEVLNLDDTKKLLSYYAQLYSITSRYHAVVMISYSQRIQDRNYFLKNILEQALKVIKFQYEALSRRITVESHEKQVWSSNI